MKYLKYFNENVEVVDKFINAMNIMTIDETVDYVIEHCKEFIENPIMISRYLITGDELYFRSEPIERKSRDMKNWYTLIMDNSKNWKDYPKRGKSFICHFQRGIPTGYLVIPEDHSKWAIAPTYDIYSSFVDLIWLPDFFQSLDEMMYALTSQNISDNSFEEMKSDIKKLENIMYSKGSFKNLKNFLNDYIFKNSLLNFIQKNWDKDLFESIVNTMNPKRNNFKLIDYNNMNNLYIETKKECWTESKCVFISLKYKDSVIKEFFRRLSEKVGKNITIKYEYN